MFASRRFPILLTIVLSTVIVLVACSPLPSKKTGKLIPITTPVPENTSSPKNIREPECEKSRELIRTVRVTAYNSMESQTDSTPTICAWGDKIRPGIIAVSRDLEKLGLTRGKEVHVEGFGKRIVLDRMHRRKTNQIDIFMESYDEAIQFGIQELKITWVTEGQDEEAKG